MKCMVGDVYRILDEIAPFETQMDFDNAGLLLGSPERGVDTILTALDATAGAIREAKRLGAQLIVTHHPVFFRPVKRLVEDEPEARNVCEMIRAGISLIAAHTNFDMADGGVNDALVAALGWQTERRGALMRFGRFEAPVMLETLRNQAAQSLGCSVTAYGGARRAIASWAVCSGAGGADEVREAAEEGADLLLTGEIRHHEALEAMERGVAILEAGHFGTEFCAARQLAGHLQRRLDELQYNVKVFASEYRPFA